MRDAVGLSPGQRGVSHRNVVLLCLLLVALLLRLGMVLATPHPEDYPDVQDFLYHANSIIEGRYPDRNVEGIYSFRGPFYPFFLSLFLRLFGERFIFLTLFQALTGVVLVYAIYLFSRRLFDEQAALISVALASIYPYLLDPIAHIQMESLYTLLAFTAILWFVPTMTTNREASKKPLLWAAGAGVLYGLAILCRPSALLMILILGAWVVGVACFWIREWKTAVLPFLVLLLGVGVVVLPWTIRNYIRFSELIVVNNQAGEIFWLGNNPHYVKLRRAKTEGEFKENLNAMWAEARVDEAFVRRLTPGRIDRYWWKRGWEYVSSSPGEWVSLLLLKWVDFWRPWLNPAAHGRGTVLLSAVFSVPVFVGGALGMAQLFRAGQYRHFTLLLAIFAVHGLFFTLFLPTVRHRTPSVDVFLLALAGGGFGYLATKWRGLGCPSR